MLFMKKCKICSNPTECWDVKNKLYRYCKNCEFIFLDKKYIVSEDKEKERYLKHNNSFENEGYVKRFEEFIKKIFDNKKDIKTALDFGSGPNPVLKQILEMKGIKTDYYDLYFQPVKVFNKKKYDLITCTEVFEHLKDPIKSLETLKKHINNEGIIVIMTLFHPNLERFKHWWYNNDETHICFYTEKTFNVMALQIGLSISFCDDKDTLILKNKQ
jgi:hypothetical protein